MPTPRFTGDGDTDEFGNPIVAPSSTRALTPGDQGYSPFGGFDGTNGQNIEYHVDESGNYAPYVNGRPAGSSGGGDGGGTPGTIGYAPRDDSKDSGWDDTIEVLGWGESDKETDARNRLKTNEQRWQAAEGMIPGMLYDPNNPSGDMYIDPYSELNHFSAGPGLDLSQAKNDLWNPNTAPAHSAAMGVDFTESDKTGRNAQKDSLNYFGDVMKSGHDAKSDAYYQGKRGDAEQAARAQREAAMQNLDEQGRGSGANALLAEMTSARDVGRDANTAALNASAMAQARKDNAATSNASTGYSLQNQDNSWANDRTKFGMDQAGAEDDWQTTKGGWNQTYGNNKSSLSQNAAVTDYNRGNQVNDNNVKMNNAAIEHNAEIPKSAWDMYMDTTRGLTGATNAVSGSLDAAGKNQATIAGAASGAIDDATKVVAMVNGMPPPPSGGQNAGEEIYDPITGQLKKK